MERRYEEMEDEEENGYLKPALPKDFVPVATNEADAFRSLDKSDSEEEEEGFLKKKAESAAIVPEVEDESTAFRSIGHKSEEEESEKIGQEENEKWEEVLVPSVKKTAPPSFLFDDEPSAGITVLECGCCTCCPYHNKEKKKEKEKKSRRSLNGRSSSGRNGRRLKSASAIETRKKMRRPSRILLKLLDGIVSGSNAVNENRLRFVCTGFKKAMLYAGVLKKCDAQLEESRE